jgi:hypothetical protein
MAALVLRQSLKRALKRRKQQQRLPEDGEEEDEDKDTDDEEGGQGNEEEEAAEAGAIVQLALQSVWAPGAGSANYSNNGNGGGVKQGEGGDEEDDLRTQLQHLQLQMQVLSAERDEAMKACGRSEVSTQRLLKGAAATRTFFTQKVSINAVDTSIHPRACVWFVRVCLRMGSLSACLCVCVYERAYVRDCSFVSGVQSHSRVIHWFSFLHPHFHHRLPLAFFSLPFLLHVCGCMYYRCES